MALGIKINEDNFILYLTIACMFLSASALVSLGYLYYSSLPDHTGDSLVLFADEANILSGGENIPVLFVGDHGSNLAEYVGQFDLKAARSVGVTYLVAEEGLDEDQVGIDVTYWNIIVANENTFVAKIGTTRHSPPSFYRPLITTKGIYLERIGYLHSIFFWLALIIGIVLGMFASIEMTNRRRKSKKTA